MQPDVFRPREPLEESALHSGHLAAPRFAQYCHRCLRFADSSIVSLSGKKNRAAVPGNSVGNGTFKIETKKETLPSQVHFVLHCGPRIMGLRFPEKLSFHPLPFWH